MRVVVVSGIWPPDVGGPASHAPALAAALREAGATHVIIAGRPIDGVDDSAAMGVDALAFLTRTREALA